jgi:hypothetical protein
MMASRIVASSASWTSSTFTGLRFCSPEVPGSRLGRTRRRRPRGVEGSRMTIPPPLRSRFAPGKAAPVSPAPMMAPTWRSASTSTSNRTTRSWQPCAVAASHASPAAAGRYPRRRGRRQNGRVAALDVLDDVLGRPARQVPPTPASRGVVAWRRRRQAIVGGELLLPPPKKVGVPRRQFVGILAWLGAVLVRQC